MPGTGQVTWVGHATVDIHLAGGRFVTDPLVRRRVAHLVRHAPPAVLAPGPIDAVLVSHLHHDHLDVLSLRTLAPSRIVLPRGARRLLDRAQRALADEVAPGDVLEIAGVRVTVVPANHDGGRTGCRVRGPALGFVLEGAGRRVYFPGDTDLFDEMALLEPPDLALLPIWGWGPTLGPGHLDPARAAEAATMLRARAVVPVHWGTYAPIGMRRGAPPWLEAPLGSFLAAAAESAPRTAVHPLRPGEHALIAPHGGARGAPPPAG